VEPQFSFTPDTWDRLDLAGITVMSVLHVLYHSRAVRRHIGAVLQVAGHDQDGRWLVVASIEQEDDDTYQVVGARWLDDDEVTNVNKMLRGDL
jgi:hypothetical protein